MNFRPGAILQHKRGWFYEVVESDLVKPGRVWARGMKSSGGYWRPGWVGLQNVKVIYDAK